MIAHAEIKDLEVKRNLREDIIEKDYIIGWLLWGIGRNRAFRRSWIFKGGTCLKKCYLDTPRISEDLDFTVLPGGPFKPDDVLPSLEDVLAEIHERSGIVFSVQKPRMVVRPTGASSEVRVYYTGPRMAPVPGRVKIDLDAIEKVVTPPAIRKVDHPFSDKLPDPGEVLCYSLNELFAEKIRALAERSRPRDLYDVVNIHRHSGPCMDPQLIKQVLEKKCESKEIPVPTCASILSSPSFAELESEWENMLAHQVPHLPPCRHYRDTLGEFFEWLGRKSTS